jgi:hypothetical protein
VTIVSDKGAVGYLNLSLSLQTFSPRQSPPSRKSLEHSLSFSSNNSNNVGKKTVNRKSPLQSKENINNQRQQQQPLIHQQRREPSKEQTTTSNSRLIKDRLLEMEMLAQVAKELETWKLNEQKKFKEDLAKKESQQMSLLGREWQDREKDRVEQYNTKLQGLQEREHLLQRKLELVEAKEKEIGELKKCLEEEQTKLKQGKVDTMQKLRKDLKTKETEASQKDSELQITKVKLTSVEQELNRIKSEKEKKKDTQASLQTELRRSKDDVLKLQTQLEIRSKELELMESQKNGLYKDNQDLKADQQNRMQDLFNQLKASKDIAVNLQQAFSGSRRMDPVPGSGVGSAGPSPRPPSSGRTETSRSSSTRTPDTQVELLVPGTPSSSSGKHKPTSLKSREVNILKDIQRMERDRDMMMRAGYLQDDDVIRMFEEKIAALYQQIRHENEDLE